MNTTRRLLRYLNFTCCSVLPLTCCIHWGRLEGHNTSVFLVLIFVPAWMHANENRSSAFWRPCWEVASSNKSFAKAKDRFCSSQRWHPRPLGCDCLSLRFSNFHEAWPPSKFNSRILNTSWHLGYAISRQSYPVKASTRGPQGGPRAPFEKAWFYPIHRSPEFLGEDNISHCTTSVRGPNIWSNVIVSG